MDGLREQLLAGLPVRVQAMGEQLLSEWAEAVRVMPIVAPAASQEVIVLLRMSLPDRERALRERWARRHGEAGVPHVHLPGRVMTTPD